MREVSITAAGVVTAFLCLAGPVRAQSAVEGPLAAPASTSPTTVAPAKPKHHKPAKTAHRSQPTPASPGYDAALPAQARPVAHAADVPGSPVDFGMKWNGSSDSARETRVQNYDGNAQGTGAEVGMKLHF